MAIAGQNRPRGLFQRILGRGRPAWCRRIGFVLIVILAPIASGSTPPVPTPNPPELQKPAPARGRFTSRLAVLRVGEGKEARTVIALARPTGPSKLAEIAGTDQSILARELFRQAILIAARDELGLATRDELLDDVAPPQTASDPVVFSVFRPTSFSQAIIEGPAEVFFGYTIMPVPDDPGLLATFLPIVESLSRNNLPKALKKLGVEGKPNTLKADGPLPPKVASRLEGLSFIDHFAAIRDLHQAIRNDGESPERIAALSRAYAQLGLLTEFHWHPAHKVYKARSLLYAERLLKRNPASAWALWNRAFVKSVLGFHQEALNDLAEASKHLGAGRDATPPAWIAPAEAYAKNDLKRLSATYKSQHRLARFLRMLALEYPLNTIQSLEAATEVVNADGDCYRAYDAMCRVGGVGNLHAATLKGADAFTKFLPEKLAALTSLPPSIRRAIGTRAEELAIGEALDKAGVPSGDGGEPSWGSLAHLIRETRFVQVARRLIFMRTIWSVPTDDYWADVQPYVAKHRNLTFLELYALPPAEVQPRLIAFANAFDRTDLEAHEPELYAATRDYATTRGETTDMNFAFGHGDELMREIAAATQVGDVAYQVSHAKKLLSVSPGSTLARTVLVRDAWDQFKDHADAWEKDATDSPVLLNVLGNRYRQLKQFDRAQRLLRRCVELSPDQLIYESLAKTYSDQGDMEGWRKVLDEYIARGRDFGLGRADVAVKVARYAMGQKRWKDAAPYAEYAASSTGAAWAMQCAVECYESSGEWEKGEGWVKALSERYSDSHWDWWYSYCARTGHGDAQTARAWTDAYLDASRGRPDLASPVWAAYYYWLSGSTRQAQEGFDTIFNAQPSAINAFPAVLVADEAGSFARRDELLKRFCTTMKEQAPKTTAIYQLMRDSLAADKSLDLEPVEAILKSLPAEGLGNMQFYVGKFLLNRGRSDAGLAYLRKAAESPDTQGWMRLIARVIVRERETGKQP